MTAWLNMGEILKVNAQKFGDKIALKDARRQLSFSEYNERSCRLANGFMDMGLKKGDRLAVISTNCLEFMEIYTAVAKAGVVVVPINWRLAPMDMQFIINNSDSKAVIVRDEFVEKRCQGGREGHMDSPLYLGDHWNPKRCAALP
jgi:acyl-CoA synthetase (AMP-forming)/AMP-acid ligase II